MLLSRLGLCVRAKHKVANWDLKQFITPEESLGLLISLMRKTSMKKGQAFGWSWLNLQHLRTFAKKTGSMKWTLLRTTVKRLNHVAKTLLPTPNKLLPLGGALHGRGARNPRPPMRPL